MSGQDRNSTSGASSFIDTGFGSTGHTPLTSSTTTATTTSTAAADSGDYLYGTGYDAEVAASISGMSVTTSSVPTGTTLSATLDSQNLGLWTEEDELDFGTEEGGGEGLEPKDPLVHSEGEPEGVNKLTDTSTYQSTQDPIFGESSSSL